MKFVILRETILPVLANIQGLTGRKSNLIITSHVLVTAEAKGIRITATDLETGFEGFYPAAVEKTGSVTIDSSKFLQIVKDFPVDEIVMEEVENNRIEIGGSKVQFHMVGMDKDAFPDSPVMNDVALFTIESGHLKKMIDKTVGISGASEDKRAHIIGVSMEKLTLPDKQILRLVSTDGGRLSKMDYEYGEKAELPIEQNVIIPKKGLSEVSKFLDLEGIVQLGIQKNKLIIQNANETFIIRLLEGIFPDYKKAIEKKVENDIRISKRPFLMMLKRMSILGSDHFHSVRFKFIDNTLFINSVNPDLGESKEVMEIEYTRPAMKVTFNPRFFIEALNVMDEDEVMLNVASPDRACILEGKDNPYYLAAIMPMNL